MKLPQTKSFKFCINILCKYTIWQIVFDWNFLSSTNLKIGRSGICIEWLLLSDFNIIVKGHCCFMYYRPWERKKVQGQRHIHQFLCKRALLMLLERFEALHRRIKSWGKILFFFKAEHKYFWKNHILSANIELLLHLKPTMILYWVASIYFSLEFCIFFCVVLY